MLAGTDVLKATNQTLSILTALEFIEVDQDVGADGAIQGKFMGQIGKAGELWVKPLSDGDRVAVLLLNLDDDNSADLTVDWSQLNVSHMGSGTSCIVRDLWTRRDLGVAKGRYTARAVGPHASAFLVVRSVAGTE